MSWIAKNDITGKTYGREFESIYDCQKYIDTELVKLQFLYAMIVGLESDFNNECKFDEWYKERYKDNSCFVLQISARFEYAFNDLFNGLPRNPRNNVIRAYNLTQKRYADAHDF